MLGAVGARHLGRDVAVVLEEVQVPPGELGEVVRLARVAAHRAGEQAAAIGGDLKVQFMRLFASIEALTDRSPRRCHPQALRPVSDYPAPSTAWPGATSCSCASGAGRWRS